MPAHQSLVDVNPDKLFEEHTIAEIKEIHKKLQAEIERKRVEIRTMVGERYRDLIQAADTIRDMKSTSQGVISHIESMSEMCQQLQQVHLLGFKQDSEAAKHQREVTSAAYQAVAVQVRVLVLLPEQIWTALDNQDYLPAAQLYLLANSITSSLKLNIGVENSSLSGDKVLGWFPVISRQWSSIRPFQALILAGCEHQLQATDLSDQEASRCLAVLVLLGGGSSLGQCQARLLSLRTEALREVLRGDQPTTSLKTQIQQSLRLTLRTLSLLTTCFQDCGENSVAAALDGIVNSNAPPVSSLLDCLDEHSRKHLPPIIKNFRPHLSHQVESIGTKQVDEAREIWLREVRDEVGQRLGHLLSYVNSVHGVEAVREAAHAALSEHNQDGATKVWESVFRPLLTQRVRTLIEQQLNQVSVDTISRLQQSLNALPSDKEEQDLRWFVWREAQGDLPGAGGWMSQTERTVDQTGGLLMKSLGYSPGVQKLCRSLDSELKVLLEDLLHYTSDTKEDRLTSLLNLHSSDTSPDKFVDRSELHSHLQTCTFSCIQQIVTFVKLQISQLEKDSPVQEVSLIFLGRFLQAVCDLCPHLQRCTSPSSIWDPNKPALLGPLQVTSGEWQKLASQLSAESLCALRSWSKAMAKRLIQSCPTTLLPSVAQMLDAFPQWEVVKIEEEGVSSQVRVPSQPSLPLHSALHTCCQEMNTQAPHALPRAVHQELVENLVSFLLMNYEKSADESLCQSVALQALFDVKYISSLLILRDSKVLTDKCQSICEKLENKIDPFDLDVFQPYLQTNIKKSVYRTQHLFGCLVPPAKMAVLSGVRVGTSEAPSPDDPTSLPLSSGVPWFPLLPVATPGLLGATVVSSRPTPQSVTKSEPADRTKSKKSSSKVDPSPTALVRSGAAALFGAMSSEWFGSS